MTTEDDNRIAEAAEEIEEFLFELSEDEEGIHANTLICTAAAVAGESLLRLALNDRQLAGKRGAVSIEDVDALEIDIGDGCVLDYLAVAAEDIGMNEDQFPDIDELEQAIGQCRDNGPLPELALGDEEQPQYPPLAAAALARQEVSELCTDFELDRRESAQAVVLALCSALESSKEVLPPEIGFRLAVGSLIMATRFYPLAAEQVEQMTGS